MKIGLAASFVLFAAVGLGRAAETEPAGYALTPISGADGRFERVTMDGRTVLRAARESGGHYALYLYFRAPETLPRRQGTLYLEVVYKDVGSGGLWIQYNGGDPIEDYRRTPTGFGKLLTNTGEYRTAVFEMGRADLRGAQNLGADLRVATPGPGVQMHIVSATIRLEAPAIARERLARPWNRPYEGPSREEVDATTLKGKVICGYQGWFRCPGDPEENGWIHWSSEQARITPKTLTFELWPDMSDYSAEERYPAQGFTLPDGRAAELFSSANERTVERHFEWMRQYGIDGVEVQRFLVELADPPAASRVLGCARAAAHHTGRVFYVGYDLSGTDKDMLVERISRDWHWLVDEMKVTSDSRYLHQNGKPVVYVFGFYPERFDAATANAVLDVFRKDPKYDAVLIGGVPWEWRRKKERGWPEVFARFDVLRPWNVGNWEKKGDKKFAATGSWADDLAATRARGQLWQPVLYPGFGWDNMMTTRSRTGRLRGKPSEIPRLGGEFLWRQFNTAATMKADTAFVAMFDEVDEGTAIFKVTNAPPREAHFQTYEGKPSDWYMRLVGEGTRMFRGERALTETIPITP